MNVAHPGSAAPPQLDTLDYLDAERRPGDVISRVQVALKEGSARGLLHLQHDLLQASVNLVPAIIGEVRRAGYRFVGIDECLHGPNYFRNPSFVWSRLPCGLSGVTPQAAADRSACPVSDWSDWSPCDTQCGTGTQTRVRMTLMPDMQRRSAACSTTTLIEAQVCDTGKKCSPGIRYSEWSGWSQCSQPCHGGTQIAGRSRVSGPPTGSYMKMRLCNMQPCLVAGRLLRGADDSQ